jgi:phosphoribosylaminoimidazole carboxylase (NCAIR synthetase)
LVLKINNFNKKELLRKEVFPMGRYEKIDSTSAIDSCLWGMKSCVIKDKETGKEARGYGWNAKESEDNAWKNLKKDK